MPELADIGYAIANTPLDLEELAELCYVETTRFLETDFFQLGLFEEDRYRTIICIREGKRVENREFLISPENEGIFGWIHRTGESLIVSDFEAEAEELPAKPSYEAPDPPNSAVFVPLLVGEDVIGVLSVQSRIKDFFTEEHHRILTFIASVLAAPIALALINYEIDFKKDQLHLIEDISRQLISPDTLDSRLSEVIILISDSLDAYSVAIYEYQDDQFILLTSSISDVFVPSLDQELCTNAKNTGISQLRFEIPLTYQDADVPSDTPFLNELCVPLIAEKQVLGLLQVVQRGSMPFSVEQRAQVEMIAANIALAILESRNYNRQQEENWITTVLLEVARHAAQPGDVDEALQAVLQLTTLLTGTTWAMLLVPEGLVDTFRLGPSAGLGRQSQFQLADLQFQLESFGIPSEDSFHTPIVIDLPAEIIQSLNTRSAVAVPVISDKSLLGLFLLEGQGLPERQMSLIEGIANQISLRLENYRLIEEVAVRRSLERELDTARSIQESFLPRIIPYYPGWEIGVTWRVARQVGGDFYDFIPLDQDEENPRWGVVIADVTDKGIPASLFMALSRTLLRSVSIRNIDPGKTLSRLNELIFADTQADLLISVFYAVWEPKIGRFTYANAGHNPPLMFYPQQPARILSDHDIVIGAILNAQYTTKTIDLKPGELIVLYTDGVTEATDVEGQMFGLHRLENLVLGLESWKAQEVADLIMKRVSDFCGTPDLSDDLTTIVLHKPE
jgi:serine phosphatase RsbU (regulator of sigma subunit)/putative methionine-R-sulfoxide reductase with GAF domain